MIPTPPWAAPTLVGLGVLSSFSEAIGIMLIPLFVYSMMNQLGSLAASGGLLGFSIRYTMLHLHSSSEIALLFLLLIVFRGALAYSYSLTTTRISERISQTTRDRVHTQYLRLPYGFVRQHEQADLAQTLGHDAWLPSNAYVSLTRVLINIIFICILGILLAALSWRIALCVIVGSIVLSSVLHLLSARARAVGGEVKRVHRDLWGYMMITLQGMRAIRAFGQEDFHQERFDKWSQDASAVGIRAMKLMLLLDPLTEIGYLVTLCIIVIAAPHFGASFATTLTCIALLYRLQPHVRELEGHRLNLLQLEPQLQSVRSILEAKRDVGPLDAGAIVAFKSAIRFENVTFRYRPESQPALDRATFEIPSGRTTALVGASGSGKTSVVNLLLGLYRPSEGAIRVDGVLLDTIDHTQWLKLLAVAGQDVDLVDGTVLDNVRMANANATEQEVAAAASLAGVSDLLQSLPDGYETWIGQQGLRFSGGQRQRIGLARALLHHPEMLILDEAMNAMEFGTEERIREAIHAQHPKCTVLVITHQLETIAHADHVIYLKEGRVVAEGEPDDVLVQAGSELNLIGRRA